MATYTFPTSTIFAPALVEWGLKPNVLRSTSPLSGQTQTVELPGARWSARLTFTGHKNADRATIEAWFAKLRGSANRVSMWHPVRPAPIGTMRGSPTVYSSPIAVGATSFVIQSTVGATIKPGDMIALGTSGQLVMITNEYTGDGNGRLTCEFTPPCRTQVIAGANVVWDKPTATFILMESPMIPYQPVASTGFTVDLLEVF